MISMYAHFGELSHGDVGRRKIARFDFEYKHEALKFFEDRLYKTQIDRAAEIMDETPSNKPIGTLFVVRVGDNDYLSEIDQHNVQRFIENPDHYLVKMSNTPGNDLNEMCRRYYMKEFSQQDYAELNIFIGYSVYGFSELSNFHDMILENPSWNYIHPDDTYLYACYRKNKITASEMVNLFMERDGDTRKEIIEKSLDYVSDPDDFIRELGK